MKYFVATAFLCLSGLAHTASIPTNLEFPFKNGPANAIYKMTDHPNGVFVFEVYQLSCGDCNANAPRVNRLADEYAKNVRVQILDTGFDKLDSTYPIWINRQKPNHPVIKDGDGQIFYRLSTANVVPQVFIVNCKGELVGSHVDQWDATAEKQIRGYIDTALKTTCTTAAESDYPAGVDND